MKASIFWQSPTLGKVVSFVSKSPFYIYGGECSIEESSSVARARGGNQGAEKKAVCSQFYVIWKEHVPLALLKIRFDKTMLLENGHHHHVLLLLENRHFRVACLIVRKLKWSLYPFSLMNGTESSIVATRARETERQVATTK